MTRLQQASYAALLLTCLACGGVGSAGRVPNVHYATPIAIQELPAQYQTSIGYVSSSGKMVGIGYDIASGGTVTVPVYWSSPSAAPVILKYPNTGENFIPNCINDSGAIVGISTTDPTSPITGQPVIWDDPNANPTTLPLPAGYPFGRANGINNDGQIVGQVASLAIANGVSAAYWEPNHSVSILKNEPNHPMSSAGSISNSGTIYGTAIDGAGSQFVFPAVWTSLGGDAKLLRSLQPPAIYGGAGVANMNSGSALSYGLYDPASTLTTAPTVWELPSLNPIAIRDGAATHIGDDGVMCGNDSTGTYAMIWPSVHTGGVNMNNLIPKNSGWFLTSAQFQMSDGTVIGYGDQTISGIPTNKWFYCLRTQ